MMVRTVGSGTNGLGYYMYHGGTTPSAGNFFMAEGFGLNNKSYDYQSPIGEFGKASSGYYPLKLINYFLKSFGSDLAPLHTVLPAGSDSIKPHNISTLRYAVRTNGDKGYLFMHNFQDHLVTADKAGLKIEVTTQSGVITFPSSGTFTLKSGSSAILPFNINLDGVEIRMATVQPFCKFSNKGKRYHVLVSLDGISPEMMFKGRVNVSGSGIKSKVHGGNTIVKMPAGKISEMQVNGITFLILPYEQALSAYLVGKEDQYLVISKSLVLEDNQKLSLISSGQENFDISVYPSVKAVSTVEGTVTKMNSSLKNISQWQVRVPEIKPEIQLVQSGDRHFVLKAPETDWSKINDIFITFDYRGDRGICMMHGELQTDNLYTSKPWTVGLKRYAEALRTNEMYFYFIPMQKDAPYLSYLDNEVIPDFGDQKEFLEVKNPKIEVEYKIQVTLD